jgi:hypothetical protein
MNVTVKPECAEGKVHSAAEVLVSGSFYEVVTMHRI